MLKKITPGFLGNIFKKYALSTIFIIVLTLNSYAQVDGNSITYFEDFNSPGYPANVPDGEYWTFHNEIHPSQDDWNKFIPGDGNAYITVDADVTNDTDWIHPFQTLEFGGVAENHRLEVRMKGAVVDGGLVGFLFTYNQEGSKFNEVDIEVVANDSATPDHETLPENNGWTDARFNTWRNANENSERPFTGTKKAVVNQQNEKTSLIDDQFHIYTIDWRADKIDFYIDEVLQETITTSVATGWSEVIIGFRQLPWAGNFNWSGTHTMVIDYLKVEPLENITFATNDTFSVVEDVATNLDVLANDSSSTTIVSYDAISVEGFPVAENSSLLNYTPSGGFIGQDSFTYTIEDENGTQKTATVTVNVEKYIAPLMAVNDAITVATGSSNTLIDATDNDSFGSNGENATHPLTLPGGKTATASNNGGAISVVDGQINYSAPTGFTGIDTFEYIITDGNGFADKATVTVTVGGPLVTVAIDDFFSIDIDTAKDLDVLANDTPNTSIVSYDVESAEGFSVSKTSSMLTYTPTGGFTGVDSFTYTIEDGNGVVSTATVNIMVEEEVIASGVLSASDDTATVSPSSTNNPIDVTDNDEYGENGESATHPLTLTNGKITTASKYGGAISVVNGHINYSAPTGFTGIDTFEYTITDGNGFADKAVVTVTVGGPVVAEAANDSFSVVVDTATDLDVLANDTFGTTIVSYDTESSEGFLVSGTPSLLTYTPSGGFIGQDSFTYTIEDGNGNQSTATVNITVKEMVISSGVLSAEDDTLAVDPESLNNLIDVTDNDDYGANGESSSHPLTLTNGKMSTESNNGGTLIVINGQISYSAPTGFTGIDTFEYTITDGNGFADKATVTVTVGEPVDANAVNDSFSVDVDSATDLDVLDNDSFGTTIVSFDAVSTEGFTVSGTPSLLTYTPSGGFLGTDSFTYTIEDGNGLQSTATVNITVEEVVIPSGILAAVDDILTVTTGASNISIDVTNNDTYGINGENASHPLTLSNGKMSTASKYGGAINVVNGKINYSTPTGFTGIDSFEYTITDGNGFADKAVVTITVNSISSSTKTTNAISESSLFENSFSAYPNPSSGYVKSTLLSNINTTATLILFDVSGKVVYNSSIDVKKGQNQFELNLNLKAGIVFMKIISSEVDFGTSKILFK